MEPTNTDEAAVHGVDPQDAVVTAAFQAWLTEVKAAGDLDDYAVDFPGLERAVLGIGEQWAGKRLLVYGKDEIISELRRQNDWDEEAAQEWFEFNIQDLWAGNGTPIILHRVAVEDVLSEYGDERG